MHYRVFTIPVCDPSAADELNRFLSGHRVLALAGLPGLKRRRRA